MLGWALAELVEAGARSGNLDVATAALRRLGGTHQCRRHGLGARHRARAVMRCSATAKLPTRSTGRRSNDLARAVVWSFSSRARSCSTASGCAGEGRRVDAREQLRAAHERVRRHRRRGRSPSARGRELPATGETVRKRTSETRDELTPQEAQIARLAGEGRTNPEIGRAAVHQPAHRRVAPAQGVREARHRLPEGAPSRAARRRPGSAGGLTARGAPVVSAGRHAASRTGCLEMIDSAGSYIDLIPCSRR